MAELSLDFKNEIINETINEKRRYVMTENEDGTVSFTDATSYSQTGTKYGAEEVIEEREAINQNTNVIGGDAYDSSKSYAAGDCFIYNNQLCKALTAISAETSLSEGTNYEVTSLENEIAGLNGNTLYKVSLNETFTDGVERYIIKKNGIAFFALNSLIKNIGTEWINLATLTSADIYPYFTQYIYSIPVRNTGGTLQIMVSSDSNLIKSRYVGGSYTEEYIQDVLIWVTQ